MTPGEHRGRIRAEARADGTEHTVRPPSGGVRSRLMVHAFDVLTPDRSR